MQNNKFYQVQLQSERQRTAIKFCTTAFRKESHVVLKQSKLRSNVKVEVAVLGSPSPIIRCSLCGCSVTLNSLNAETALKSHRTSTSSACFRSVTIMVEFSLTLAIYSPTKRKLSAERGGNIDEEKLTFNSQWVISTIRKCSTERERREREEREKRERVWGGGGVHRRRESLVHRSGSV